jgi:hypothetical protein
MDTGVCRIGPDMTVIFRSRSLSGVAERAWRPRKLRKCEVRLSPLSRSRSEGVTEAAGDLGGDESASEAVSNDETDILFADGGPC